jgi:hypothetical protein
MMRTDQKKMATLISMQLSTAQEWSIGGLPDLLGMVFDGVWKLISVEWKEDLRGNKDYGQKRVLKRQMMTMV